MIEHSYKHWTFPEPWSPGIQTRAAIAFRELLRSYVPRFCEAPIPQEDGSELACEECRTCEAIDIIAKGLA